jgi:hypothetical protein
MLSEISQTLKDKYHVISSYIESKRVHFIQVKSRVVVTKDWRKAETVELQVMKNGRVKAD